MSQPSELIDVAELASQRREAELDHSECEWTKIPEPLQPGMMPLTEGLAVKCGLEPGTLINADEFFELMMLASGLPATYKTRRKDVRPHIWDIVLKRAVRSQKKTQKEKNN